MVEARAGESADTGTAVRGEGREGGDEPHGNFAASDIIVQVLCYGSNDKTGHADLPLLRNRRVLVEQYDA